MEKVGDPEVHLVLVKPEQDAELSKAIKEHRVLTVVQETVGEHADQGLVGFELGKNRQFLIFPKSLRSFDGKKIVGIKYDLLKEKEIPKSQRAAPPKPPRPKKEKPLLQEARTEDVEGKPPKNEAEDIASIKKKVRRAMKELEQGRPVVAFNLLKEIVME